MIPKKVKIVEVGPRDGLQNEKNYLPLAEKISFIKKLISSGLSDIEVTSFVRSDKVPQLKDAKELFTKICDLQENKHLNFISLVPNLKGFEVAESVGVKRVALFTATSEKFCQANVNSSIENSLKNIKAVASSCVAKNVSIRGYISTVFGCPYEGKTTSGDLEFIIKSLQDMGINIKDNDKCININKEKNTGSNNM